MPDQALLIFDLATLDLRSFKHANTTYASSVLWKNSLDSKRF